MSELPHSINSPGQINKAVVCAVYEVRRGEPGFSIPVFKFDTAFFVQQSNDTGFVDGFLRCDIRESDLSEIPSGLPDEAIISEIGLPPLFSFKTPDFKLHIGPLAHLQDVLRKTMSQFHNRPFLMLDIAEVLQDNTHIEIANLKCKLILAQSAKAQAPSLPAIAWSDFSVDKETAFEVLYSAYAPALQMQAIEFGVRSASAEDVAQETFIALARKIETSEFTIPQEVSVKDQIFQISKFKIRNELKRQRESIFDVDPRTIWM